MKNEYKDLVLQSGRNSKASNKMRKSILKLDRSLKKVDKSVGDNYRNIGNYTTALVALNGPLGGAVSVWRYAYSRGRVKGCVYGRE